MDLGEIINAHQNEVNAKATEARQKRARQVVASEHGKIPLKELLIDTFRLPDLNSKSLSEEDKEYKKECAAEQAARLVCALKKSEARFEDYKEFAYFLTEQYLNPSARADVMQIYSDLGLMNSEVKAAYRQLIAHAKAVCPDDIWNMRRDLPQWFWDLPKLKEKLQENVFSKMLIALSYSIEGGTFSDSTTPPSNIFKMVEERRESLDAFIDFAEDFFELKPKYDTSFTEKSVYKEDDEERDSDWRILLNCDRLKCADSIGNVLTGVTHVLLHAPEQFDDYFRIINGIAGNTGSSSDAGEIAVSLAKVLSSQQPDIRHRFVNYAGRYLQKTDPVSPQGIHLETIYAMNGLLEKNEIECVEKLIELVPRCPRGPFTFYFPSFEKLTHEDIRTYFELVENASRTLKDSDTFYSCMNAIYDLSRTPRGSDGERQTPCPLTTIKEFVQAGIKVFQQCGRESAHSFFGRKTQASNAFLNQSNTISPTA